MNNTEAQQAPQQSSIVEWAVARQSIKADEKQKSTKEAVVKSTPSGFLMVVIDAIAEGAAGEIAASVPKEIFESFTHQSLIDLYNKADRQCKSTGGCSISAALFNTSYHTVSWFGVGNVQGLLYHRSPTATPRFHKMNLQTGFVGDGQFTFREATLPIKYGDITVLGTVGVSPNFVDALPIEGKPRIIADQLLAQYVRKEDDALMLVTRYLGGQ